MAVGHEVGVPKAFAVFRYLVPDHDIANVLMEPKLTQLYKHPVISFLAVMVFVQGVALKHAVPNGMIGKGIAEGSTAKPRISSESCNYRTKRRNEEYSFDDKRTREKNRGHLVFMCK